MSEQERKIAFVGTSSAGKTTLIERLHRKYADDRSIAFVAEAARTYFTENPHIQERFSVEVQTTIQNIALANEKEAHASRPKVIFCDRSVIDAVAYVRASGDRNGAEELFDNIVGWLPTYHKFLLVDPSDIPYRKDNVRQEEKGTRDDFHKAFLELFKEKAIPFELLSGTIEDRLKRVEEILQV